MTEKKGWKKGSIKEDLSLILFCIIFIFSIKHKFLVLLRSTKYPKHLF